MGLPFGRNDIRPFWISANDTDLFIQDMPSEVFYCRYFSARGLRPWVGHAILHATCTRTQAIGECGRNKATGLERVVFPLHVARSSPAPSFPACQLVPGGSPP